MAQWKLRFVPREGLDVEPPQAVERELEELEADGWTVFQMLDAGDRFAVLLRRDREEPVPPHP